MIGAELFGGAYGAWGAAMYTSGLCDRITLVVEKEPWRRKVLAEHGLYEKILSDIREVSGRDLSGVEVLAGSPPCKGFSVAGRGAGFAHPDSRLWFEMLRLVEAALPELVLVENAGRGWKRWVPTVRSGLGDLGYASVSLHLSASEVGAPHERLRCFVVGGRTPDAQRAVRLIAEWSARGRARGVRRKGQAQPPAPREPGLTPDAAALDGRLEEHGRGELRRVRADAEAARHGAARDAADADRERRNDAIEAPAELRVARAAAAGGVARDWAVPTSADADAERQLAEDRSDERDERLGQQPRAFGGWAHYVRGRGYWGRWPARAVVPRVDDGVPVSLDVDRVDRAAREAAAGDAIVYPCALTICLTVKEALDAARRKAA